MPQAESSVSEYIRIRRYVLTLIQKANGKEVPLPSILELSNLFHVSRPTVSRAMKALTEEGYVIGKRGIGSFANPAKRPYYLNSQPIVGLLNSDGRVVHFDKYLSRIYSHLMMELTALPAIVHQISLTSGNPETMFQEIRNEQLDVLVWQGINSQKENEVRKRLIDSGLPVISSENNYSPDSFATVRLGLRELGYRCGRQLIAEGRKNLVYLPASNGWTRPLTGIRRAYEEAGIPLNKNLFLENVQTCLEDFRKLLSFGVPVDAVFNALYIQNEVTDILREFHVDLRKQCRLIQSDLCFSESEDFHGFSFDFAFQKHARKVAFLAKKAIDGEPLPQQGLVTELNLNIIK